MKPHMKIGGRYNWRGQEERLVYLGKDWSGNCYWHQFALTSKPDEVWCEVIAADLEHFEETSTETTVDTKQAQVVKPAFRLSPRQERKQRKAAKRATQAAHAAQGGAA